MKNITNKLCWVTLRLTNHVQPKNVVSLSSFCICIQKTKIDETHVLLLELSLDDNIYEIIKLLQYNYHYIYEQYNRLIFFKLMVWRTKSIAIIIHNFYYILHKTWLYCAESLKPFCSQFRLYTASHPSFFMVFFSSLQFCQYFLAR